MPYIEVSARKQATVKAKKYFCIEKYTVQR